MLLLGFADYRPQCERLAAALGCDCEFVDLHHFPDGESRLRLPETLPGKVVICRSLDHPNGKLLELLLAAEGARTLGARHVTLVAPYLCYMRQDKAFTAGEVVSQRVVGRLLADHVDALVTVDPHLHRIATLNEAVPVRRAVALSAAPAMGAFLADRESRPLLLGPDRESAQWVRTVAGVAGLEHAVASKTRRGDRSVDVVLPERDFVGREVVLVDDMVSTGRTLVEATRALLAAGAVRVNVLVTHALFVGDALDVLVAAGASQIWSSDSVTHPTNAFPLATVLAGALI